MCRDPSLGLVAKKRDWKGVNQKWSPGITFHALKRVGGCEGMNPHTPKWAPTLGVGVPMDSWIFKERLQGSKLIRLKSYLNHWKALGTKMSMWIIDLLVNHSNPHLKVTTCPFTLKMLRARERTLTPPFVVFTFGLIVESTKEFGGASHNIVEH